MRISPLWRRIIFFTLALLPFAWLVFTTITQQLGADPAKVILLFTGEWALYFLLITLSVTPLRRFLGWGWLMTHRRMLGLFALFYAVLHLLSYLVFILGLDFNKFIDEMIKRPYITAGFPALVIDQIDESSLQFLSVKAAEIEAKITDQLAASQDRALRMLTQHLAFSFSQ